MYKEFKKYFPTRREKARWAELGGPKEYEP